MVITAERNIRKGRTDGHTAEQGENMYASSLLDGGIITAVMFMLMFMAHSSIQLIRRYWKI